MKKRLFVLFFFVLCLNSYGQNPLGFSLIKKNQQVELSFQNESNLIVIPIIVNGKGPYNFILDTGSESGMIFDKWVISDYNLVDARKIPIYSGEGNKVTDLMVANDLNIEFKGVRGTSQSMLVFPENDLDIQNSLGVEALGVLGSEIFNRFVVEVNYEKESIRLYEPSVFKIPKGFKKLDIEVRDLRPFLKVGIRQKGEPMTYMNLLIDTGASSALFLDAESNPNISLPKKNIEHTVGSGLTGNIYGKVGRVHALRLGKFKFKSVVASYPENWKIRNEIKGEDHSLIRYGTIGSDVLSRFTVIYDYFNEAIYLKKNRTYKDKFKFNTIGLRIIAKGTDLDKYFVNEIIPNSPAERANIKVGDEIIAINGRPVFFYKFSEINTLLRANPRTRSTFILRSEGQLRKVTVKHKKMI